MIAKIVRAIEAVGDDGKRSMFSGSGTKLYTEDQVIDRTRSLTREVNSLRGDVCSGLDGRVWTDHDVLFHEPARGAMAEKYQGGFKCRRCKNNLRPTGWKVVS